MKEVILVAGKSKSDVCWLRRCLREKGVDSIPCNSAKQIIEEMEILPTCDTTVPLVILEPEILENLGNDLIAGLTDLALEVPFLLTNEAAHADLAEVFDTICEYRMVFKQAQNPTLAAILKEFGIEATRNQKSGR